MFYDREYNADELRRHCGSPQQLARISSYDLREGKSRGTHCLDFNTGSGFSFTVVPGRGMDIAFAEFKGRNLVWLSPVGVVSGQHYEQHDWGWMHSFFGGLLTTCGLINVGVPDSYEGDSFGAHGRISNTPATNISHDLTWVGDELYMLARGEMRESRPPIYNLVLRRRIQTRAGERSVRIHDTVINEGFSRVPHQILYHINAGFPILTRTARFVAASQVVTPRDQLSEDAKEHHRLCNDPTNGFQERVFYHEVVPCTDGRAWAAVINPDLDGGMGLYVKYDPKNLPLLAQWKMMAEGTYVMGIEPTNTYGIGLDRGAAHGRLRMLEPGEEIDYHLEIGVLSGADEIEAFEREISVASPKAPEYASVII